jgi:hypothetical protein
VRSFSSVAGGGLIRGRRRGVFDALCPRFPMRDFGHDFPAVGRFTKLLTSVKMATSWLCAGLCKPGTGLPQD